MMRQFRDWERLDAQNELFKKNRQSKLQGSWLFDVGCGILNSLVGGVSLGLRSLIRSLCSSGTSNVVVVLA